MKGEGEGEGVKKWGMQGVGGGKGMIVLVVLHCTVQLIYITLF